MSRGKYSPNLPCSTSEDFKFNAYGKPPVAYELGQKYDEKTMFGNYDRAGFDMYGYSAFDADGTFVGAGNGVDRNGYTEYEYLVMPDEQWFSM